MLLDGDGFDHYGGNIAITLNGITAQYGNATITNAQVRTGTHCLAINANLANGLVRDNYYRRVVPQGARNVLGTAFGLYLPNLPNTSDLWGFQFRDIDNNAIVTYSIATTGHIKTYRGSSSSGTLLGVSDLPMLVPEAWNWCEFKAGRSATVGFSKMRVNGVLGLNVENVNTNATGNDFTQYVIGGTVNNNTQAGGVGVPMFCDDLFVWDSLGDYNNDWLGDRQAIYRAPTADHGAIADFLPSTGADLYPLIDEVNVNEADYIRSLLNGDAAAFEKAALPADITGIAGIIPYLYGKKLNAGPCSVQLGALSGGLIGYGGSTIPITTTPTFWRPNPIEVDPATDLPFEPAAVDAAYLHINRVA